MAFGPETRSLVVGQMHTVLVRINSTVTGRSDNPWVGDHWIRASCKYTNENTTNGINEAMTINYNEATP